MLGPAYPLWKNLVSHFPPLGATKMESQRERGEREREKDRDRERGEREREREREKDRKKTDRKREKRGVTMVTDSSVVYGTSAKNLGAIQHPGIPVMCVCVCVCVQDVSDRIEKEAADSEIVVLNICVCVCVCVCVCQCVSIFTTRAKLSPQFNMQHRKYWPSFTPPSPIIFPFSMFTIR